MEKEHIQIISSGDLKKLTTFKNPKLHLKALEIINNTLKDIINRTLEDMINDDNLHDNLRKRIDQAGDSFRSQATSIGINVNNNDYLIDHCRFIGALLAISGILLTRLLRS